MAKIIIRIRRGEKDGGEAAFSQAFGIKAGGERSALDRRRGFKD